MADTADRNGAERPGSVGSVAEETARLLDALLGAAPADGTAPHGPDEQAYAETAEAPRDTGPAEPCPTCGHEPADHRAAADEVCRLCPVCQLLRVVRAVRPETLDRLADLAGAVTETLRDVAASRRREAGPTPPRPARPPVEDIPLDADVDGDMEAP